jgi:hypothetical protein
MKSLMRPMCSKILKLTQNSKVILLNILSHDVDVYTRQVLHQIKQQSQCSKWVVDVIPSLIGPYLELLGATRSLRYHPNHVSTPCTCGKSGRKLKVVCVYFESMFLVTPI